MPLCIIPILTLADKTERIQGWFGELRDQLALTPLAEALYNSFTVLHHSDVTLSWGVLMKDRLFFPRENMTLLSDDDISSTF